MLDAGIDDGDISALRRFVSSPTVIVRPPSTIHVSRSAVSWECRATVVPGS